MADLVDIQKKVRRITRSPSESQLTTAELNEYINNFLLYDLPYNIQLFDLRRTLTFYTSPYVDTYETHPDIVDATNPLYDFKNRYINVFNPIFVAGYPATFTQDRNTFWSMYPMQNYITPMLAVGNGVLTNYTGTLTYAPILQGTVSFDSIGLVGLNQVGLTLRDQPNYVNGQIQTTGTFIVPNDPTPRGTINYVTGAYDITFPIAPMVNATIYSEYLPYTASRPFIVLFYDSKFYVRPVPDTCYQITMDVSVVPTYQLSTLTPRPDIDQWWQYIAYGASKKIFEDRMDLDSVQLILPEFQNQEVLCMRKTIINNASKRSSTIYTQPMGYRYGYPYYWNTY